MSVVCESIASDEERNNTQNIEKDSYEEELDYEEELEDAKSANNNLKSEDGELSDNDNFAKEIPRSNKRVTEKDEGELDEDDDLEEGEVKEEENDANVPEPKSDLEENGRVKNSDLQEDRNSTRHDAPRPTKVYSNNWSNSNQNYNNSRYANRNERYSNNRNREYVPPPPAASQSTSESAWERGLKQARELLSKASKRKEEEVDFDNKRFNLSVDNNSSSTYPSEQTKTVLNRDTRERSPTIKRRRYSSQHSSSEDEVERRHRLAYDAAPWNNPNSSSNYQTTSNYRSRANYSSNRSAETYRDPWRRSKSPKLPSSRSRRPEGDTRYGEVYKRDKNDGSDPRRSNSMSSLSSIGSDSSKLSGSQNSPGRKLPYSRPNLETKGRYEPEGESNYRNDYPKSRMDRIPKKSNASHQFQSNDRISDTKSFDSWSESLSDSDSSSFFSNSDSDSDESDVEAATRDKSSRPTKALSEKRAQAKLLKQHESKSADSSHHKQSNKDSNIIDPKGGLGRISKSNADKESNKKPPIKMTFMKTQTSLKKDRLIDEQLNGEAFDPEDLEANNSRSSKISSNKSGTSKSHSEDEDSKNHGSTSQELPSSSNKVHRREELLLKLKAVEEAIERKLNSKRE